MKRLFFPLILFPARPFLVYFSFTSFFSFPSSQIIVLGIWCREKSLFNDHHSNWPLLFCLLGLIFL